jgi:DNA-directed RNA polymerase II subunit RPB1
LIPVNKSLPEYIGKSINNRIRTRLFNELCEVSIYPEMYDKFKEEIVRYYYKSLTDAGLACGIQASTSLGERQTQTTLNSFHAAGLSVKTVVVGVPRFSELLNATKSPKMVNCLIYMNEEFNNISEIRNRLGNSITDICFKRLIKSYELIKDDPLEEWHYLFCKIYNIKQSNLGWRLRFYIDLSVLYEYKITLKLVASAIMNEYADSTVLYTPDWKGIIDVFVDESCFSELEETYVDNVDNIDNVDADNIDKDEEKDQEDNDDEDDDEDEDEDQDDNKEDKNKKDNNIFNVKFSPLGGGKEDTIPSDIIRVIHMEDKILPSIKNIRIAGIENIKDIFFEKRKDEWVITTEGSNLYGLFSHPLVDKTKTMCNDMWEIYRVLGIEAARQFLIEEYMDVVSSDGSFINSSHVELLVDVMVYTGTIISISRYGQKKVGCGPMAKASFEESLENFLKAGINGEKETTNGVSASIMLGKMPKTGTGVLDLYLDIPKIIKSQVYNSNLSQSSQSSQSSQLESSQSSKSSTKFSLKKMEVIKDEKDEKENKDEKVMFKKNPFFDD